MMTDDDKKVCQIIADHFVELILEKLEQQPQINADNNDAITN